MYNYEQIRSHLHRIRPIKSKFSAMVQNKGIDELRVEKVMELVHITATKNFVTRNISIMVLGGIHERTPTLTSRGFIEEDFMKVNELFNVINIIDLYFKDIVIFHGILKNKNFRSRFQVHECVYFKENLEFIFSSALLIILKLTGKLKLSIRV